MPPLPIASNPLPRLVLYYQTHHGDGDKPVSILPLLTNPDIALTHLIIAALHINEDPSKPTLNDHPPGHPRNQTLWAEVRAAQAAGVKVMGMLGGAAKGTYVRLDGSDAEFERYYTPVRNIIRTRNLDGIDIDVEEEMSLGGVIRLIDRLRSDFGPSFIITLAPVAMALLDVRRNLSGFDYEALEVMRGREIAWYNTQFYCGWGDFSNSMMYEVMIQRGWPAEKIVVGLVTNPDNGRGYVSHDALGPVLRALRASEGRFGGIMGWEYFNGLPGKRQRPWEWAKRVSGLLRGDGWHLPGPGRDGCIDGDEKEWEVEAPRQFEYHSDGFGDD